MAGGGALPGSVAVNQRNAEIYSPPYLFKGPRPTITTAPSTMQYGASFDVTTPNAAQIAHVSLIRSPSVTHAIDMNQRFQYLNFTPGAGKVTVQAPANANLAPPGDYMLFLVDTNGVPSVASFVRAAGAPDTTPPTVAVTAPAAGSTVSATISVTATAGDDDAVAGVQFKLDGSNLGAEDTTAPYTTSWDTQTATNGSHSLTAVARDLAGNTTTSSPAVGVTVSNAGPLLGLVAAYGFDQTTGTTLTDVSGQSNHGSVSGATWTTSGKYGSALSFDGVNDLVTRGRRCVTRPDERDDGRGLGQTNRCSAVTGEQSPSRRRATTTHTRSMRARDPGSRVGTGSSASRTPTFVPPPRSPRRVWTHLATTYDGNMLRIFVNGVQSAQLLQVGSLTTSTGLVAHRREQHLAGVVPGRHRRASGLQPSADGRADLRRTWPRASPTPTPSAPTAPGNLSASGSISSVALSWTAATDNTAVARYNVHRGTTAGFTPSVANRIAQPTGTTYTDTGLAAGTYYYRVTAEDAAGNIGPASSEATGTTTGDVVAPSAPGTLTASAGAGSAGSHLGSGKRQRRRRPLQRPPFHDCRVHADRRQPHRAGHDAEPHRRRARSRHVLLPGHRRGRRRQHRPAVQPGMRDRVHRSARRVGRGLQLRPRIGHGAHGPLRNWEPRLDQRRNLGRHRKVRRSAHVRRRQRHRQRPRLAEPRSHVADDARGLDSSHRARQQLAHRPAEGADRQLRLWALRKHRHGPAERECDHGRLRSRPPRDVVACAEHVDPPGRHLQRLDPDALSQRRIRGNAGDDGRDHDLDRWAEDRRHLALARVVPGRHRRSADLQPRAQRSGDPDRHERECRQP